MDTLRTWMAFLVSEKKRACMTCTIGHASTSCPLPLAMPRSFGEEGEVIAVVGRRYDGRNRTEALNNGPFRFQIIVILNDNEMSIERMAVDHST